MEEKKIKNLNKDEELERISKNLSYAVKFTFGKIESQALVESVRQMQERSA